MAPPTKTTPTGKQARDELLSAELAADPEFAAEWERLSLARMVAARLVGFRSDNGLSQRALAELLGVSQPRVVELESGEKNPQVETLVKISAATGLEFAIYIVPVGQAPKLVGKAVTRGGAHVYAGASVLVASS
jgi:DNA-binding XRE family transcriptional regulator